MIASTDSIGVLYVDDEPDRAGVVETFLERADDRIEVRNATSIEAAERHLAAGDVDCVVCDYDMPDRTGIEFLESVREASPHLPVILYTGKGSETVASDAIAAGATDYLRRANDTDQYVVLAARIANAVEAARTRRSLETLRERADQILDATDSVMWVADTESGAVSRHGPVERVLGRPTEEIPTWEAFVDDAVHPEDRNRVLGMVRELIDGERSTEELTFRIRPTDGPTRWIWTRCCIGDRGERIVGLARDVTERRERERKLELIGTVFESARECQFIVDVTDDGFALLHANAYYKQAVGLSSDESVTGRTAVDLFGADAGGEILDRYAECVERRESISYTVELPVPEEGTVYRTIVTPVVDDGAVTHIVGTARDITERRERERELRRTNERLDQFAGIVSHDLRNPLNVAAGSLKLARDDCDSEHLDRVERAHERMEELVEDLLTLARHGDSPADVDAVDLGVLVQRCWQNVDTGEATLAVEAERAIRADDSRLAQLFENLVRNAVEHGSTDSRPGADDSVEHEAEAVTITVGTLDDGFYLEDDGPGIPEDRREAVFELGYSTGESGTGFGLQIVEQIVEAHDWDIRVTGGTMGGARFEVTGVEFAE